jgi:diadenosine tetraphosphate (Ap4A) HIT family hydrolase
MLKNESCPLCEVEQERILHRSHLAIALMDAFPVSQGHCLIIPCRHVGSWFDTTQQERRDMIRLLDEARNSIKQRHDPAGFNIGINDGTAAGQTVPHLHVHLIPRYAGDAGDPRGGVRWVLPERADYWSLRK